MDNVTHSYIWHVRHGLFVYVTWRIHACATTHSYMRHDSFILVTWLVGICDITHSYTWHDSLICVTWHIHIYVRLLDKRCYGSNVGVYSSERAFSLTWLMDICDMTHSYTRHDSFIHVIWLSFWFICVTWLIHTRDMTQSDMWCDSCIYVTFLWHRC